MLILTIRTDNPQAEIGLYNTNRELAYYIWPAHRQLAETIHVKIMDLLKAQTTTLTDLNGLIVFKGPGSFTSLRIGLSVANALADSLQVPIVTTATEAWIKRGITALESGVNEYIGLPEYGALANVTSPKK